MWRGCYTGNDTLAQSRSLNKTLNFFLNFSYWQSTGSRIVSFKARGGGDAVALWAVSLGSGPCLLVAW